MNYAKPEIRPLLPVIDTIRHARSKGLVTLLDSIFPILVFTTPMAYDGDE